MNYARFARISPAMSCTFSIYYRGSCLRVLVCAVPRTYQDSTSSALKRPHAITASLFAVCYGSARPRPCCASYLLYYYHRHAKTKGEEKLLPRPLYATPINPGPLDNL